MTIKDHTVFEDQNLIIINKPIGIPVQTSDKNQLSLESLFQAEYDYFHFINRIDQAISGLVMVSKSPEATKHIWQLMKDEPIEKYYMALVEGHPISTADTLTHFISKKGNRAIHNIKGKKSILSYETHQKLDRYTFLKIKLETGRFHQIRFQLAQIGHPVKGDVKYGARRANKERGIYLHSHSIIIRNYYGPSRNLSINASFPSMNLWNLLNAT